MKRKLSNSLAGILGQATSVGTGVADHGAAIPLKYVTAEDFTEARQAVVDSEEEVVAARTVLRQKYNQKRIACKQAQQMARLARETLKPTLGEAYSSAWNTVGFRGSFTIPIEETELERMVETMKNFFIDNPSLEVAATHLTAVKADELYNAISNGRTAIESQKTIVKNLLNARNLKVNALKVLILTLFGELDISLDRLDPRWLSFGLPIPGLPKTPVVPTGLMLVQMAAGTTSIKWNRARRAGHYRIWMRVAGTEVEFDPMGSSSEPSFLLEGLPSNTMVEITISAVNEGGESQKATSIIVQTM